MGERTPEEIWEGLLVGERRALLSLKWEPCKYQYHVLGPGGEGLIRAVHSWATNGEGLHGPRDHYMEHTSLGEMVAEYGRSVGNG